MKPNLPACIAFLIFMMAPPGISAADDTALWQALRGGGHVALIRHALAPGTGDPAAFELGNCSTQRNLDDEGRDQARRIGAKFRKNGIVKMTVYSSQWCRCLETAKLMGLGEVQELPELNSLYRYPERRESQTRTLKDWIAVQPMDRPLILVTHQFTINALVDQYTTSGEMVIVRRERDSGLRVIGAIRND